MELRRRKQEERLRDWQPTKPSDPNPFGVPSNDQEAFLYSTARIRAAFGGNRSGKTEAVVADASWFAQGIHPVRSATRKPPVYLRFMGPSWEDSIKAVVLKKFKAMVPRAWLLGCDWSTAWSEKARTLSFANGSLIRFFSYEQDVNKLGGDDIDAGYLDEHAPHDHFLETLMRTVDRNGYLVLSETPEAGITWELEEIIEKADEDINGEIDYWYFSIFGNPNLSAEAIRFVESKITDERLKDAKLYGHFVVLSGVVLPQFNRSIHVIPDRELPEHWHRQFIIDPHHRKPSAMLWRVVDPEGVSYAVQEAEFAPAQGGVKDLAEFIRTKSAGMSISQWIIDEAMGGEGMNVFGQKSVAEQLKKFGIPVVSTNLEGGKMFDAGIMRMRDKLSPDVVSGKPSHVIFQSLHKLPKQYEQYRYKTETKTDEQTFRETVANVFDDLLTCDRYGMSAEPSGKHTVAAKRVLPQGARLAVMGAGR